MAAPVILLEAQPANAATGAAVPVRLAGGGALKPYHYFGEHWKAGIRALPTIVTRLNVSEGDYGAGGVPQAAVIEWAPAKKAALSELAAYFWRDAPITVRIGPEGSDPAATLAGKVMGAATTEDGTLKISMADPGLALKKPLLTARYAGTGGLAGPAEWEGRIRPRIFGRVWNVKAECIDKANSIYCVSDPLKPLADFVAVRDKGADAAQIDVLPWQGSSEATFAALKASTAPKGGCVIAPTIACLKWWTTPAGDLCVDVQGEYAGGYVETAAQVAERLVAAITGPAFAAGTVAEMAALRPDPVGWMVGDDSTTAASALDALLGDVSLLWLIELNGQIRLRAWAWSVPVMSAVSEAVVREEVYRPISVAKIGYRANQNVMARGDIAGIVFATDVTFNDGKTAQELQPAQPGADVTGSNIAAGFQGSGALAYKDKVNAATDLIGKLDIQNVADEMLNSKISLTNVGGNVTLSGAGGGSFNLGSLGAKALALRDTVGFGDGSILESAGVTATLAKFRTGDGIAAGFVGSGALAYQNIVTAGLIEAGAITASKLAVIAEGIMADPYFNDMSYWIAIDDNGWVKQVPGSGASSPDTFGVNCVTLTEKAAARRHMWGRAFALNGSGTSSSYRLRATGINQSADWIFVALWVKNYDGSQAAFAGYIAWPPSGSASPSTLSSLFTIPAWANQAQFVIYNNGAAGISPSHWPAITGVKLDIAASAEMIVDGTIISRMMAADAVTTRELAAGAVIAENIAAGNIIGHHIAAGAVTADKISANSIASLAAAFGDVVVKPVAGQSGSIQILNAAGVEVGFMGIRP